MLSKLDPTPILLGRAREPISQIGPFSTEVTVDGLQVMADIGVHEHEVGNLQPLHIDVRLEIRPVEADRISETFDYSNVLELANYLATQRTALIETFAQRLAAACLASPLVLAADVRISKPRALPGCRAGTRVKVRRNTAG